MLWSGKPPSSFLCSPAPLTSSSAPVSSSRRLSVVLKSGPVPGRALLQAGCVGEVSGCVCGAGLLGDRLYCRQSESPGAVLQSPLLEGHHPIGWHAWQHSAPHTGTTAICTPSLGTLTPTLIAPVLQGPSLSRDLLKLWRQPVW